MTSDLPTVTEPFPISLIHNRYLLFSIDAITYIRRVHHITGVLIGSIPQIPQQNVFLGVPLQLMPEEARLLVENGAAFIVDDVRLHDEGLRRLKEDERAKYVNGLRREGEKAARMVQVKKGERTEKVLAQLKEKVNASESKLNEAQDADEEKEDVEDALFAPEARARASSLASSHTFSVTSKPDILGYAITPTASFPPLTLPTPTPSVPLPEVPTSYPLFAHLHSHGYFLSPGLRFGCQYLAYPGDPLRFHSHFLARGMQWDEEIALLDLVGGGRLGTGVKKGFLIGGVQKEHDGKVRTFCIEWGGM